VCEPPSWINQLKLLPDFQIPDFWQNKENHNENN